MCAHTPLITLYKNPRGIVFSERDLAPQGDSSVLRDPLAAFFSSFRSREVFADRSVFKGAPERMERFVSREFLISPIDRGMRGTARNCSNDAVRPRVGALWRMGHRHASSDLKLWRDGLSDGFVRAIPLRSKEQRSRFNFSKRPQFRSSDLV